MATWREGHHTVLARTTLGESVPIRVGTVSVGPQHAVGMQVGFGTELMLSLDTVTDLIRKLQVQRSILIRTTGGL